MAIAQLTLSFDGINVSAQVGDMVYYSYDTNNIGGFDHSELTTTKKLGEIVEIHINATNNVFNINDFTFIFIILLYLLLYLKFFC